MNDPFLDFAQQQQALFEDVVNAVAAPLFSNGVGGDVSVEVKLSRSDRVYHAGERLNGEVVVTSGGAVQHNSVVVHATGAAQMRVSEQAVGVFEAFFLNIRPVALLSESVEVCPAGRFEEGVTRLPFSVPLQAPSDRPKSPLYETYHGVNVNVQYGVSAELDRSLVRGGKLSTGLIEFIIEEVGGSSKQSVCDSSKPVDFVLRADEEACAQLGLVRYCRHTLCRASHYDAAVLGRDALRIVGRLDHGTVAIQRPVSGWIKVERCVLPLRSIELTLGRVEWCTVGDHSNSVAREATDIQCTQVADGDVARGVELPIHLVLPRLYTCPTVDADSWGVEFELSVTAVMETHGGAYATACARMPLQLVRS